MARGLLRFVDVKPCIPHEIRRVPSLLVVLALAACGGGGTALPPTPDGGNDADGGPERADGGSDGSGGPFERMVFELERRGPGTEITYLVTHDGSLFAAENIWSNEDRTVPSRILRKAGPDAPWETDFALPQNTMDAHITLKPMVTVTFERDADGKRLDAPETLLVAGSSRFSIDEERWPFATNLWTRIGAGDWARTVLATAPRRPCDGSTQPGTRSMAHHYDPVLDREWLFVGTAAGTIYRVGFDPDAPGRLVPEATPIFQGSGRVSSLLSTPRGLFASVAQKNLEGDCRVTRGLPEGLLRYRDGTAEVDLTADPAGAFEHLDTWESDDRPAEDACRGLSLLPHPTRAGEQAIFCGLEDPGHIIYWEDRDGTLSRVLEFDLREGIADLGTPNDSSYRIGPYNGFTRAEDPATGEPIWLVGLYFRAVRGDPRGHVLVRSATGSYRHVVIPPPDGQPLRGVRATEPSPWAEDEGRVFYFGGFDAHAGPHAASSWIIRGTVPDASE